MTLGTYQIIFSFFVPIWIIGVLMTSRSLLKARPNKTILDKYPKRILFLLHLPFWKKWKQHVDKEDVKLLAIYQSRLMVWYLSATLPFYIIIFVFICTNRFL